MKTKYDDVMDVLRASRKKALGADEIAARVGKSHSWTNKILMALFAAGDVVRERRTCDRTERGGSYFVYRLPRPADCEPAPAVGDVVGVPYPRVIVHGPDAGNWIGAQLRSIQTIAMLTRE